MYKIFTYPFTYEANPQLIAPNNLYFPNSSFLSPKVSTVRASTKENVPLNAKKYLSKKFKVITTSKLQIFLQYVNDQYIGKTCIDKLKIIQNNW